MPLCIDFNSMKETTIRKKVQNKTEKLQPTDNPIMMVHRLITPCCTALQICQLD